MKGVTGLWGPGTLPGLQGLLELGGGPGWEVVIELTAVEERGLRASAGPNPGKARGPWATQSPGPRARSECGAPSVCRTRLSGGKWRPGAPGPSPHHQLHSPPGTWGASRLGSKCPEADSSLQRQTGKTLLPCVMGQEEQPWPPRPSPSFRRGLCHQSPSPGQLSLPFQ